MHFRLHTWPMTAQAHQADARESLRLRHPAHHQGPNKAMPETQKNQDHASRVTFDTILADQPPLQRRKPRIRRRRLLQWHEASIGGGVWTHGAPCCSVATARAASSCWSLARGSCGQENSAEEGKYERYRESETKPLVHAASRGRRSGDTIRREGIAARDEPCGVEPSGDGAARRRPPRPSPLEATGAALADCKGRRKALRSARVARAELAPKAGASLARGARRCCTPLSATAMTRGGAAGAARTRASDAGRACARLGSAGAQGQALALRGLASSEVRGEKVPGSEGRARRQAQRRTGSESRERRRGDGDAERGANKNWAKKWAQTRAPVCCFSANDFLRCPKRTSLLRGVQGGRGVLTSTGAGLPELTRGGITGIRRLPSGAKGQVFPLPGAGSFEPPLPSGWLRKRPNGRAATP